MGAPADPLAAVLDRPGGDPRLRGLALVHGLAVAGDFEALEAWLPLAVERGASWDRLTEALLQVVPYGGFPRAITALGLAAARRPAQAPRPDLASDADRAALASAGRRVFQAVYGANTDQVLAELDRLAPGFDGLVLEQAYGRMLDRPILSLGEREVLAVAGLALAALPAPLGSHIRGALANGFAPAQVQDILHTCTPLAAPKAVPVIAQAIDRIERKVYSR